MRVAQSVVSSTVALWLLCSQPALAQVTDVSVPTAWEPAFWDKAMTAIKDAQKRDEKLEAETLCSKAIPYVETQAVRALRQYAELLEELKAPGAIDANARAERLAQVKAEQSRRGGPSSSYLGFSPADELYVYAGALQASRRESDAQAMRLLAAAYRRTQEVYIRRSILMREGKDPRGEC